jgi:SAM-dependent methyltransferase
MEKDKIIEFARYDTRAQELLNQIYAGEQLSRGMQKMASYIAAPYSYYARACSNFLTKDSCVLELGAGMGFHTEALLRTGAQVTASDILPNTLRLLRQHFPTYVETLNTAVADMESLPFEDSSFDVIASVGSLSYGNPCLVNAEIRRVLRPGGSLMCVDSLNHNPIYRLNRWAQYLRGNRSMSTLKRMPNLSRIKTLVGGFKIVDIQYFGAISFAMPAVARCFGDEFANDVSEKFDKFINVKRSAFKFVIVARGLSKST